MHRAINNRQSCRAESSLGCTRRILNELANARVELLRRAERDTRRKTMASGTASRSTKGHDGIPETVVRKNVEAASRLQGESTGSTSLELLESQQVPPNC